MAKRAATSSACAPRRPRRPGAGSSTRSTSACARRRPSRTVDRIARMAGVARSTVYLIFGSRAGLFDALGDDLLRRARYAPGRGRRATRTRASTLRGGIRAGAEMYATDRDVARPALHGAARRGGRRRRDAPEEERARGIARLARRLAEQGVLRPDVGGARPPTCSGCSPASTASTSLDPSTAATGVGHPSGPRAPPAAVGGGNGAVGAARVTTAGRAPRRSGR